MKDGRSRKKRGGVHTLRKPTRQPDSSLAFLQTCYNIAERYGRWREGVLMEAIGPWHPENRVRDDCAADDAGNEKHSDDTSGESFLSGSFHRTLWLRPSGSGES